VKKHNRVIAMSFSVAPLIPYCSQQFDVQLKYSANDPVIEATWGKISFIRDQLVYKIRKRKPDEET
jgi:hypothetical protein